MHSTHVNPSAQSTPTHDRRPLKRRPHPKRDNGRKSSRGGSSHLTKFIKVPNSWFKLRPMANQRKTWDREDRKRRSRIREMDTERPSWLFNLNEPRDVDEHPARLVQFNKEDVPPPRLLRRERRWFRRERRRKRRYRTRGVDTERPSWLLNLNEPRDVDDELPPRDVDDERPSWLLNLNEPRDVDDERPACLLQLNEEDEEDIPSPRLPKDGEDRSSPWLPRWFRRDRAQRRAKAARCIGKLMNTKFDGRWCYVAGRRRRVLPNGSMWRRYGHRRTAAIFHIMRSIVDSPRSKEQFSFHVWLIVARGRIKAASSAIKKMMLRRWILRQYKFNASLGYPGEGPVTDESRKHKCSNEWCTKSYKWKYHLTRHKSGCRDKRGDVECSNEWCGKRFQRPGDLARHQKDCRDTPGKFACKVCSRRFVRREDLARHAGKCAKCQYCPEIFESTARFVRS